MAELEGKASATEEAMSKMTPKAATEEIKGEEKSEKKFRTAHEDMLYNLNRAR